MHQPDEPKINHVNDFSMALPIFVSNRDMVFPSTLMPGMGQSGDCITMQSKRG
jgi:hypothetical protein